MYSLRGFDPVGFSWQKGVGRRWNLRMASCVMASQQKRPGIPVEVEDAVMIAMFPDSQQSHLEYASYCITDAFCR